MCLCDYTVEKLGRFRDNLVITSVHTLSKKMNHTEMPDFRIYSEFRIFSLPISTVLFIFSPFWVNLPKFTHFFRIFEWHSLAPLIIYFA